MGLDATIREAGIADRDTVTDIERRAFGRNDEAALTSDLLADPTAAPCLSLIAVEADRPVGHILFTAARIVAAPRAVVASILAPLAVVPQAQGRGIGGKLIAEGLRRLEARGGDLVFVLGHPGYYRRSGFATAGRSGLEAPYPIPKKDADAWMVRPLRDGIIGAITGRVVAADTLMRPEYWRE